MEPILIASDLLLLLFWVRLWTNPEQEFYFNPFLSGPMRLVDGTTSFLRPILPFVPERAICLLILAFGLVFRAALFFRLGFPWSITLGAAFPFTPRVEGLPGALAFSLLDFLFFIARFWSLYLLVQLLTPVLRRDRATQAFHYAALPFSLLRRWAQLIVLVAVHLILVREADLYGKLAMPAVQAGLTLPPLALGLGAELSDLLRLGWLTAASVADGLLALRTCLLAFVFGGLAATLVQNPGLRQVTQEALDVLLGRFSRRPLLVGMFDLTPILFFVAINLIHGFLIAAVLLLMTAIGQG
jgi:hypothetical protein